MWEADTQRVKIHREMIAKAHIYIICILYYKKEEEAHTEFASSSSLLSLQE
jgi:hypothetical protein